MLFGFLWATRLRFGLYPTCCVWHNYPCNEPLGCFTLGKLWENCITLTALPLTATSRPARRPPRHCPSRRPGGTSNTTTTRLLENCLRSCREGSSSA